MARNFAELRGKMSPESQQRVREKVAAYLADAQASKDPDALDEADQTDLHERSSHK